MLFLCYPKCSTCQKSKKWLDEHGIEYTEQAPTQEVFQYKWADLQRNEVKR